MKKMGEKLNPFEIMIVAWADIFVKLDKEFQIVDKMNRMDERDAKLKKEHPVLWTGKKLTVSTTKALLGVYLFPPKR